MKTQILLFFAVLSIAQASQADWYVRGSFNNWATEAMTDIGNNTIQLKNLVISEPGSFKIDRFGDWSENYGLGGLDGENITIATGSWDILFYTDTKNYLVSSNNGTPTTYYFRGTSNNWQEDSPLTATNQMGLLETCQNFTSTLNPRFKIDPNGAWGSDAFPANDYLVSASWVKITVDTRQNQVVSVEENLAPDCGSTITDSDGDGIADNRDQCPNTPPETPVNTSGCTVTEGVVTLRGTFDGWQDGIALTPSNQPGIFEACIAFNTGDQDGGPRFKIDPNGIWDGDEFPLQDVSATPGFNRILVDTENQNIVSVTGNLDENCNPLPFTNDFRARSIYFMFVDRFFNGDESNDFGNNASGTSQVGASGGLGDWKRYWGGDVQGIIEKLDYLQNLGITAIWVTPLNDNIDNTGNEGAYHGYWGRDFYEVDEHLGDWELIDTLDREMEARGMKLILDIALNHSNQDDSFEFGALYKEGQRLTSFLEDNGTWYHRNGAISDCNDNNPATTCNAEWDDPWSFRNKTLFNLTDFNHGVNSNSIADNYLIEAALKWMDHGVDAFRIDAIKHMEPNFVNRFSAAIRAKNPETYIFGEWYGAGADDNLSMQFLNEGRGSELLDFNLRDNIERAIANDISMTQLAQHIEKRPGAMQGRDSWQTIFLDNHDATRTSVYLQTTGNTNRGGGKGFSKALADARQNLGMALVMTLPGIPTIYYGTEQNSTWFTANGDGAIGHDPYNREPMPAFNENTSAFNIISTLARLRLDSPALSQGRYVTRWSNSSVLVYERISGDDAVLIAVNTGGTQTISINNLSLNNGSYTNRLGQEQITVSNGNAQLSIGENQIIVLR